MRWARARRRQVQPAARREGVEVGAQSRLALTVERMKSSEPAIRPSAAASRELTKCCAPSARASVSLSALEENAVTAQPHACRNRIARWPSPPMPITPTRSVGRHAALDDRVENGDTAAEQRAGLRWIYARGQRNRPCALAAHGIGEPAETAQDGPSTARIDYGRRHALVAHHARARVPARPTVCPRRVRDILASAWTVPITSWPGTMGYRLICHSLSSIDKSEWHSPQD